MGGSGVGGEPGGEGTGSAGGRAGGRGGGGEGERNWPFKALSELEAASELQ